MLRTAWRGYRRSSVDAFLARCAATLGSRAASVPELPPPTASRAPALDAGDVRAARFPLAWRGYDMAQVDAVLDAVARLLPDVADRPQWGPLQQVSPSSAQVPLRLRRALRGYDGAEVEDFLARCAHSLGERVGRVPELVPLRARERAGLPLRARDVEQVQFHVRWWGCAMDEVDALLDRVAAELD